MYLRNNRIIFQNIHQYNIKLQKLMILIKIYKVAKNKKNN